MVKICIGISTNLFFVEGNFFVLGKFFCCFGGILFYFAAGNFIFFAAGNFIFFWREFIFLLRRFYFFSFIFILDIKIFKT
jgi:hypothetical protein